MRTDETGRGPRAAAPGQILVVGRNRSGTKWLSNQVTNHPQVAGITAPETGILEANLFEHLPRMFGDLAIDDHYYAFLACFMKSSYFQRSGLPESVLYERRLPDYLEVFAFVMNRFAQSRGASHWLQKGSSLMLPALRRAFPNAKFIIMRRLNVFDNVRSSVTLKGIDDARRDKPLVVARELASYYLHRGVEQEYVGQADVLTVTYESLRADKERVMREVCDFVGLPFDAAVLEDAYRPNTSFATTRREDVFTPLDLRAFDLLRPAMAVLPTPLLRRLYQGRARPLPAKGERLLVRGAFKTFRRQVEGMRAPPNP